MSILVVQGPDLPATAAEKLTALSGTSAFRQLNTSALRFDHIQRRVGIPEFCREHRLDHVFLDQPRRWGEFRLLAMDMDSTLITIECIDELADFAGVKSQVAAVTAAAMRGELDFAASLRQRVALLAGLSESALQRVYDERLRLSPGAERLLTAARSAGWTTLLVSGGFTFFTRRLAERLGLDHHFANELESSRGRLTGRLHGDIVDAQAKATKVASVCAALGASTREAIVLGDGANDLPMMNLAGFSVAFRAKPVVQQQATAALNYCGLDGVLNWFEA